MGILRILRGIRRRWRKLQRAFQQGRLGRWLNWADVYRDEAGRRPAEVPIVGRLALIRDFVPWYRSQGRLSLQEKLPWVTLEAARILSRRVRGSSRVFEYGAGGSTAFFGRRAAKVVSVEHDPGWFALVERAVAELPAVEVILAEPRLPRQVTEEDVSSTSPEFKGQTFIDYVTVVDRYPAHSFDVLFVDGRARPSCFFRAEPKVRVGGLVILDDSERPAYERVVEAATAAGWREDGRYGPKLFSSHFARTSIWTKTSDLNS
jgi:predicted O-methyltransferase YrrM